MSEQEKKMTQDRTTEDKMKELFDLMDQKAAEGALNEVEEDRQEAAAPAEDAPSAAQGKEDDSPMTASEAAAYEYSMMMRQYEAMLEDYQRREAEEEAEKAKAAAQGE